VIGTMAEEAAEEEGQDSTGQRFARYRPNASSRLLIGVSARAFQSICYMNPPPPQPRTTSLRFHMDDDVDDGSDGGSGADLYSSSASSLEAEVDRGFGQQMDALARLEGDLIRVTTSSPEGECEEEDGSTVVLLERLPHGDKRRRWILTSLRLHSAQVAARRRRLLCLGASCRGPDEAPIVSGLHSHTQRFA
jgi:hypothetical protein